MALYSRTILISLLVLWVLSSGVVLLMPTSGYHGLAIQALDKPLHFIIFFFGGVLLPLSRLTLAWSLPLTLWAIVSEFLQLLVADRVFSLADIGFNLFGLLSGLCAGYLLLRIASYQNK